MNSKAIAEEDQNDSRSSSGSECSSKIKLQKNVGIDKIEAPDQCSSTPDDDEDEDQLGTESAATAVIAKTQQIVSIETLPFDEWARGAVYSNLKETIGPPQQRAIPSFNDWAGGVVFDGIDLTMKAVVETNIKISSSDDKSVQQDEEEEAPHPENKLEHDITSSPTITKVPMPQHNQQEPIMIEDGDITSKHSLHDNMLQKKSCTTSSQVPSVEEIINIFHTVIYECVRTG